MKIFNKKPKPEFKIQKGYSIHSGYIRYRVYRYHVGDWWPEGVFDTFTEAEEALKVLAEKPKYYDKNGNLIE